MGGEQFMFRHNAINTGCSVILGDGDRFVKPKHLPNLFHPGINIAERDMWDGVYAFSFFVFFKDPSGMGVKVNYKWFGCFLRCYGERILADVRFP